MTHFTVLPIFVAPCKWYGYREIELALIFVTKTTFPTTNSAIEKWEEQRIDRIEDGLPPGPAKSTVLRWFNEILQDPPTCPWLERAGTESARLRSSPLKLALSILPSNTTPKNPVDFPKINFSDEEPEKGNFIPPKKSQAPHRSIDPAFLLRTLRILGSILLKQAFSALKKPSLEIGIWFLEGLFEQRFLAMKTLTGRVIPSFLSLEATSAIKFGYAPNITKPP